MKKTMMIIALFVVLIVTVSSRSDREYQAAQGFEVPSLELVSAADSSVIDLESLKGQYVVINFWAASDAESRIAAHDFDRFAAKVGTEQLRLLQVNLDRSVRLFREIVRRDGLEAAQQFTVKAPESSRVSKIFNLGAGLQSYLLDPEGKIVAVNPSLETVAKAIAS